MAITNNYKKPLLGDNSNALVWLIGINGIFCIMLKGLSVIYNLSLDQNGEQKFAYDVLQWLQLSPTWKDNIHKPWAFITYMFMPYSFMQLLGNMLWLWAFGYIMQDLLGNLKLIPLYLYGGIIGGLAYSTANTLLQQNPYGLLEGGVFAVTAIAVGTTILSPTYKVYLAFLQKGFALYWLTIGYLIIVVGNFSFINIAYLAGFALAAVVGFVFIKMLKNGVDTGAWLYATINWFNNLFNPQKNKSPLKIVKHYNPLEDKLNAILDKINTHGYDKLSAEDKAFLKDYSTEE